MGGRPYMPAGPKTHGFDMKYRTFALAAVLACAMSAIPAHADQPRAVVELFTSQGCSSCPPADRLMGQLSRDPSLVALSLPVDYWDYIGWKDTLALHGHTTRQRAYAAARGVQQIYTPQAMINGIDDALGSDKRAIERTIAQTHRSAKPLALPVSISVSGDDVSVSLPAASDGHRNGLIWLCPVSSEVKVKIGRGENRGRTISYYNVVRRWVKLGEWNGTAQTFEAKLADLADDKFALTDVDRLVVLVQSGGTSRPGIMLGAALEPLPAAAVR
jgi:hypothetical protein